MLIKNKMAADFDQNHWFKGISFDKLNNIQIKIFSTQFWYADSKTRSSSKSESVWLSDLAKNKMAPKSLSRVNKIEHYQTGSISKTM